MTALSLAAAAPDASLARRNPIAKLLAAVAVLLALFLTLDPVTPAIVLGAELVALPLLGIRLPTLLRRAWLLLIAAACVAVTNLLFAEQSAQAHVLAMVGPFRLTTAGVSAAAGITLRLLAVGLSGVVFALTTDARDLADSLSQQAHCPPKFVYAALAAMRMGPLLALDWQMLMMARRSRGVAGGGLVARTRLAGQALFALLVSAIRRGTRLAMAMDARGFEAARGRTYARTQRMARSDWLFLAATVVLVAAADAISVGTGQWHWFIG